MQLLFGVIYAAYQFAIPYVMLGSNPGPDADLMMTLIVRQSFSNNLFGFGAAASTLLMLAMLVWVAVWYRAFRRDLEVVMTATHALAARAQAPDQPRARRAHLARASLVMLAPGLLARGVLAAERRPARDAAAYDLLHPTLHGVQATCGRRSTSSATSSTALIICTAAALLATAFASTAGYALARFRFRGARPVRRSA